MLSRLMEERNGYMSADIAEARIRDAVNTQPEIARMEEVGRSVEGRPIYGVILGNGPAHVSLMAGAHADEPVGPGTLRHLVPLLIEHADKEHADEYKTLLGRCTFFILPHINPDGEERNRKWIDAWPDWTAYATGVVRELPGNDVEFSYPDRRPENAAISKWLAANGPFALHASLHGMGYSDGAMLLIEKNWSYRTEVLQAGFTEAAREAGLRLHDHNRKGEKGFFQIAPGFTTTPEGVAMRTYFRSHGKPETAALFGDSSMEFVRGLGGDPLSIVTELPLFVVDGAAEPGIPRGYLDFKTLMPDIRLALSRGEDVSAAVRPFGLNPLSITTASKIQLKAISLALETVLTE